VSTDSIGKVSYIAVQHYEHLRNGRFIDQPCETASLYTKGFAHIHSHQFLYRIPISPKPLNDKGSQFQISAVSLALWQTLSHSIPSITTGLKAFTSHNKKDKELDE